jgi:hypothetical protein
MSEPQLELDEFLLESCGFHQRALFKGSWYSLYPKNEKENLSEKEDTAHHHAWPWNPLATPGSEPVNASLF